MTGKSEIVNTFGHKYYLIRPKIPCQQMTTNQPSYLPTFASYIEDDANNSTTMLGLSSFNNNNNNNN
jgi:hypothetical protein